MKPTGAQLLAAFPPRPLVSSWPATEAGRSAVLARVLAAPFTLDNPGSQQTRRMGVLAVLSWLATHPGDSWQQRWQASGAEEHSDWRDADHHCLGWPVAGQHGYREAAATPEPGAAGADLRRCDPPEPELAAAFRPGTTRAGRRDGPHPRPARRSPRSPRRARRRRVGLQTGQQALARVAVILAAKGGPVAAVRVGDCVELLQAAAEHARHLRLRGARPQPAVLPAAAQPRRAGPGRARRDRDVLRPRAAQLRAADRPLQDRLPPGA